MKKYIKVILVLLAIIVSVCAYRSYVQKQRAAAREAYVKVKYHSQGLSYPRKIGNYHIYEYFDYSSIDEKRLFIYLSAYNANNDNHGDYYKNDLTLNDVKEYLSDPYNEDGTLRVETGWDKMYAFEQWHDYVGKKKHIPEYENEIVEIFYDFRRKNVSDKSIEFSELSIEQLEELVKKEADSTYEINPEVMGY